MLNRLVLAVAATIGATSISIAADMPVKARPVLPPPVVYYDWSGFYLGAFVGGIWGETGTFLSGSGVPIKVDADGVYGGVLAGYDWQLPNRIVLGLRVAAPIGTTADGRTADPTFPATVFHDADLRWALLFTGNIGLAMGADGRWLPYVGGGLAVGEGKATFTSPGGNFTDKHTHTGYTVLAGVRYAFANNWWGAVQYNYTDFGSETYTLGPGSRSINFSSQSVTGMLVYKWGGPVVARY